MRTPTVQLQSTLCGACGAYSVPLWAWQHTPGGLLVSVLADIKHPHVALGSVAVEFEDLVIGRLDTVIRAIRGALACLPGLCWRYPPARGEPPAANHVDAIEHIPPGEGAGLAIGAQLCGAL